MFFIVNVGTGKPYEKNFYAGATRYTEKGAKIVCTKLNKSYGNTPQWKVVAVADFVRPAVKMVERVNLMSGQKFMEAEDTPCFLSPASETYWSM